MAVYEKVTWPQVCAVERSIQQSEGQHLSKEAAFSNCEIPSYHADTH